MGLPGHRRTSSHKRRRAAHFALKKMQINTCPKCKKPVLPHMACRFCGSYAGRQVFVPKAPKVKVPKNATPDHDHDHDHAPAEAEPKAAKVAKATKKSE